MLASALMLIVGSLASADVQQLQRSFEQPPDDAKFMVRWWWFGPAVTHAQLEREMKLMKEGGIGGFEVQPTYPLALDGEVPGLKNLKFMSPEFLDALKFTAAKAKELGLRMDLTLGSGWPYGGPQFTDKEGATAVLSQNVTVPAGQKTVNVPRLQNVRSQSAVAAFVQTPNGYKEIPIENDIAQMPADVTGEAQVLFVIAREGIMAVKRPAFGAEGNVIDHYGPAAIEKFIKEIGEPSLAACGANNVHAIFCDSLEIGGENWTPTLLEEFKKRRGYDLRPLLPALFVEMGPKTADIRHDWMKTCTEMFNDNFNTAFKKLANKYGAKYRIQGYGSPPHALYSYAYADLNEAEGPNWNTFDESRWAASASHLLGRPVTSSETWTWLHSPVFRATPLDMKGEADTHFLQGITQLIAHGWPYTAEGVPNPGWSFYAAGVFNEKNPWWNVMPDVAKYMQRVSHMLRQGTPANDVLVFLPNSDAWASRATSMNQSLGGRVGGGRGGGRRGEPAGPNTGNITGALVTGGYNLDYFDDQLLEMRGKVEGNTIVFGDVKYRAVVLPQTERIMPATMKKLEDFAKAGGIVIAVGGTPQMAPGYLATEADNQVVREIALRLFSGASATGVRVETAGELTAALAAKKLAADVSIEPAAPDIGFVHRHVDDAEVYFIANTSNQPQSVKATFRVSGMNAETWDPMTGKVSAASGTGSTVNLNLEPYGSTIVVFSKRTPPAAAPAPFLSSVPPPLDLSAGWTVRFGKDAQPVAMEKLASWTEDEKRKNFSGVAIYEKKVTLPAGMAVAGVPLTLDFGQSSAPQGGGRGGRGGMGYRVSLDTPVREACAVFVNDKRIGALWAPPYRLDVTGQLKAGENMIRVEVSNTNMNYMASIPLPNYNFQAVRQQYGPRFDPQNLNLVEPLPSGLLGPVKLVASGSAPR